MRIYFTRNQLPGMRDFSKQERRNIWINFLIMKGKCEERLWDYVVSAIILGIPIGMFVGTAVLVQWWPVGAFVGGLAGVFLPGFVGNIVFLHRISRRFEAYTHSRYFRTTRLTTEQVMQAVDEGECPLTDGADSGL
jgi:hypothetical protein